MSISQAHSSSNEDERRKGKEVAVEDLNNKSTYNSLSSGESSGSEIDVTASKEVRKLARRMAKKMAKKNTDKIMKKMETMEKIMATMMKKMEKEETPSTSPKKSDSSKRQEDTRNSFDYSRMQGNFSSNFISVPIGKAPLLDELNYADWVNKMKMHLIALHPSLWEVVNVGVRMPKCGEEMTPEMMVDLHRNAQATSVILTSLSQEEFNKVNGLEVAKVIWDTLQVSHEGDHKAKLGKIELLEGELEELVMLKGETLQGLFDRLMITINKMRALGCEDWDDHKVTRWFLRAYQVKNMGLAQMIRDRDDYDEMKPHTLLGKLQQHEMADQAAIKAAERVPNAIMPNIGGASKGVALQATNEDENNNQTKSKSSKASKSKEVVVESSTSEEDSSNDEDQNVAMLIKSFKRIMKGGNKYKKNYGDKYKKRNKKRQCYECGEIGHYIADCPTKKNKGKKEWRKDKYKQEDKNKGYKKKKYHGHAHVG